MLLFKQEIKPFKLTFEIPEKNVSLESDPEFKYEDRYKF